MFQSIFKRLKSKEKGIDAPCGGLVHPLEDSKDPVFADGVMGAGCFIVPESNCIYSPADGTVEMVFPTKHAMGIKTHNGIEIMIHIGIDTVQLDGRFFEVAVSPGDKVRRGDLLATVDFEKILAEGYATDVIVVLTNVQTNDVCVHVGHCSPGDLLLEVTTEIS